MKTEIIDLMIEQQKKVANLKVELLNARGTDLYTTVGDIYMREKARLEGMQAVSSFLMEI